MVELPGESIKTGKTGKTGKAGVRWSPSADLASAGLDQPPSVRQGDVSIIANLRHLSLIGYEIPVERSRALIAELLKVDEAFNRGITRSWLSIVSFLDRGCRTSGGGAFEQTTYLLHVLHKGEPVHFLLGISIGSLSAIATRNLWPLPWHLSAMEFRVSYDHSQNRYRRYRLRTQSQWANAIWEISDTGAPIDLDRIDELPLISLISGDTLHHYFSRRDGASGLSRVRYRGLALRSGRLNLARSDVLERLGLIRRDELLRPSIVAIQERASCQIFSPAAKVSPQVNVASDED